MAKRPTTKEEERIMSLIVKAHNEFIKMEQTHPSDMSEWVDGIHKCQNVIIQRIMRRDYPRYFKTINSDGK